MCSRFCLTVFLVVLTVGPAWAGPPLLTDDTGTPGDKYWEINISCTLDKRHNEATYEAPILDFNYGLGNNIQIKYEVPWLVHHEDGSGTKEGLGNSVFGLKWRFLDQARKGINMSIYPQYEVNSLTSSADRGLVDEGTNLQLPVQVAKKFGPVWVNGEFGYTLRQHFSDKWLYGLSSGYDALENLSILGEIHGGATNDFKKHEVIFNIGTQWDFTKKYGLVVSVGRSFRSSTSDEPNLLLFLGLQMRL